MKYRRVLNDPSDGDRGCKKCAYNQDDENCRYAECVERTPDNVFIDYYFIEETEVPQ